eukprot:scaffold57473_cov79-Attheya_sp.AAC.1
MPGLNSAGVMPLTPQGMVIMTPTHYGVCGMHVARHFHAAQTLPKTVGILCDVTPRVVASQPILPTLEERGERLQQYW